jgi:hypothetical protein
MIACDDLPSHLSDDNFVLVRSRWSDGWRDVCGSSNDPQDIRHQQGIGGDVLKFSWWVLAEEDGTVPSAAGRQAAGGAESGATHRGYIGVKIGLAG